MRYRVWNMAVGRSSIALRGALSIVATGMLGYAYAEPVAEVTSPWQVDLYYENATHFRGEDATGDNVGLSKFRNTLKADARKSLDDGWNFRGIFRGTFDGVYRLNDTQYGNKAGGPIQLGNSGGPVLAGRLPPFISSNAFVPMSGGIPVAPTGDPAAPLGPGRGPAFNAANNPNAGLRVLGDRWNKGNQQGGFGVGVPVRPCDIDSRGCRDFGGYGDQSRSNLESPEFNDRLDFIREFYADKTFDMKDGKQFFLRVGKQQVVWGRTDLFRVLDVINPVDYSRNSIYDEFEDIRIPMWMVQGNYRMGAGDSLSERNLQVVWNFDKFRPHNFGQCGTPNSPLDASCFFRSMANLWDNGGTVANILPATALGAPPGTPGAFAVDVPSGVLGFRNVNLPQWKLNNTQLGIKFDGVSRDGGIAFSLNALTYRSQTPSLHAIQPYTVAFDVVYPRVSLFGGSADFPLEALNTTVRLEGAVTNGEEFVNTNKPGLFSRNQVFRSVIGLDRPTSIPFLNPQRTVTVSAQLFYQHIFDHERTQGMLGTTGLVDAKDSYTGTIALRSQYLQDTLNATLIVAHDFNARATAFLPSLEWLATDRLRFKAGANIKTSSDQKRYDFDDCRACAPATGSLGSQGIEPLGRFKAGILGTAVKEDEVFINLTYKF
jgi:hypothetical protein